MGLSLPNGRYSVLKNSASLYFDPDGEWDAIENVVCEVNGVYNGAVDGSYSRSGLNFSLSGLSAAGGYQVKVSILFSYIVIVKYTETITNADGTTSTVTKEREETRYRTDSDTIYIYTRANTWNWENGTPTFNNFIHEHITAERWNDLPKQMGRYMSWRNQSNLYNSYSISTVRTNDVITADLYNEAYRMIYGSNSEVVKNTLIKPSYFINLSSPLNDYS